MHTLIFSTILKIQILKYFSNYCFNVIYKDTNSNKKISYFVAWYTHICLFIYGRSMKGFQILYCMGTHGHLVYFPNCIKIPQVGNCCS